MRDIKRKAPKELKSPRRKEMEEMKKAQQKKRKQQQPTPTAKGKTHPTH